MLNNCVCLVWFNVLVCFWGTVAREMNNHYHRCLAMCRQLHRLGFTSHSSFSPQLIAITADKLIYNYAIELVSGGINMDIKYEGSISDISSVTYFMSFKQYSHRIVSIYKNLA